MEKSYYNLVKSPVSLKKAWKKVYENGLKSDSIETQRDIKEFHLHSSSYLDKIYRQLLKNSFQFSLSKGIPQKKKGKKQVRPIVISPISDRVVQRSILDALHINDMVNKYESIKSSFGGIEGRGVPKAMEYLYEAINAGAKWYIKSDIEAFFTKIPREAVISQISQWIGDQKFMELLENALKVELINLEHLGNLAEEFPIHSIGVAQGCCLSPLIGNLLLYEFDNQLNGRGITCIRYIDDFLILGETEYKVKKAFNSAQKILAKHNLSAYNPNNGNDKAKIGKIEKGFDFLGCNINKDVFRPSKSSQTRLKNKITSIIYDSMSRLSLDYQGRNRSTYLSTLTDINNVLKGWGNTYYFCNDRHLLNNLDREIERKIQRFGKYYLKLMKDAKSFKDRRRIQGVHLLFDSKYAPIVKE